MDIQNATIPSSNVISGTIAATKSPIIRRRRPWAAVLLSFFTPGLGQLYAGRYKRALALYCLYWAQFPFLFVILSLHKLAPWNCAGLFLIIAFSLWILVDAALSARRQDPNYALCQFNRWYLYVVILIAHVFVMNPAGNRLFVFLGRTTIQSYIQITDSMADTFRAGDYIIADNLAYGIRMLNAEDELLSWAKPQRGDLAAFRYPNNRAVIYIKRVIGLPGDKVEMIDRAVYINGQPLQENYTKYIDPGSTYDHYGPYLVPSGQYFVMGDNRDNSQDSRFWGCVPRRDILGRGRWICWSVDASRDSLYSENLSSFRKMFAGRIRWNRIGQKVN